MDYIDFDEEVTNEPMSRRESRRKYNRRLDTNYLKVEKDDNSVAAQLVRFVASGVRQVITPRQMLAILVLLALYTVVVLLLTIYSDAAFVYHECFFNLSEAVNMKLGYFHDAKLRMFGVCFAILEILIEANAKFVEKQFRLFKYFIPRSILLFFIATLSEPHPIIKYEWKVMKGLAGNDDAFNNYESSAMIRDELPIGVIRLQMFSSFLLYFSVMIYFALGILCFDQFAPNAFFPSNSRKISPNHLPQEMSSKRNNLISASSTTSSSIKLDPSTDDENSMPENDDEENKKNYKTSRRSPSPRRLPGYSIEPTTHTDKGGFITA